MSYQIKKGDLFKEAPEKAILTHACNAQGRWGRGIALQFRNKHPEAYQQYQDYCGPNERCGRTLIAEDSRLVGCMVTSRHYAPPDDAVNIVSQTYAAAIDLLEQTQKSYPGYEIHSCKLNAGLFKVPWEQTEETIKQVLHLFNNSINWVVWEL